MKLTPEEIEWLSTSPQGLRTVAEYHDVQVTLGEPMGFDCSGNKRRHDELTAEAARIEAEWEGSKPVPKAEAAEAVEHHKCTLCAGVDSPGFYTGCLVNDGHCAGEGWKCDGNGNLTKPKSTKG